MHYLSARTSAPSLDRVFLGVDTVAYIADYFGAPVHVVIAMIGVACDWKKTDVIRLDASELRHLRARAPKLSEIASIQLAARYGIGHLRGLDIEWLGFFADPVMLCKDHILALKYVAHYIRQRSVWERSRGKRRPIILHRDAKDYWEAFVVKHFTGARNVWSKVHAERYWEWVEVCKPYFPTSETKEPSLLKSGADSDVSTHTSSLFAGQPQYSWQIPPNHRGKSLMTRIV